MYVTKILLIGRKKSFEKLLKTLNLINKYPQKITLNDALSVRQELLGDPKTSKAFPYIMLQKIMMYSDYRQVSIQTSTKHKCSMVHPMDSLIALMHCCDDFLRQDLLPRLATCQLAIPLLLPNPSNNTITFMLWAMRSIVCEWKCRAAEGTVYTKSCHLVDHSGPIVSFLRIGKTTLPKDCSKSSILNSVIGSHDHFFHWNCVGGTSPRKFVDGLVELSYYLPSGKEEDSFHDCISFLNLRGEACNHTAQLNFIKKVSFMSFVVLLEENLDDTALSTMLELTILPGGLVIIYPNEKILKKSKIDSLMKTKLSEKSAILFGMNNKNEVDIKTGIQSLIKTKLTTLSASKLNTISECALVAKDVGIKCDEENERNSEGHCLASKIINQMKIPAANVKDEMLPLQGPKLWHQWAKYDKASYQTPTQEQVTNAFYDRIVDKNKKEIRRQQYDYLANLSPVMKFFIDGLLHGNDNGRKYFLQWLKLYLDDRSRNTLHELHMEYNTTKAELEKLKDQNNPELILELGKKLQMQNKQLVEGSIGLEHFFREVGQIYEATVEYTKEIRPVNCYPKAMVDILNEGYPIELMDGNASHVPITWIKAVLEELASRHKRKRILVISVLGIQSSGKSTLLNTMFGLQFNVSAGRCTKGAYLQLLPAKEAGRNKCDFFLIIDTEGLRAPEINLNESLNHDNELATFVIGLADITIININGETPGDINDILQTAVHAFIRMKNIDLHQLRCHFVHQNVAAVMISNVKIEREHFQNALNEMTKVAAISEHCEDEYHSFQDVIMFNENTDITYFPGLWEGNPPMAPINPEYSKKASTLKSALALMERPKSDSNFTNFQLRVEKLWNAVCRENYIFSFKNTLEVTAYNELDLHFSRWKWLLHRCMLEWQHEAGNSINSCQPDQIPTVAEECLKKAKEELNITYDNLFHKMNYFFKNSEYSITLVQWRSRYEIRLQHLKEDRMKEVEQRCSLMKLNRECHLCLEELQQDHRQQLLKQLKDLALRARQDKEKLTQEQLEKIFNEKWKEWMEKFSRNEWNRLYPPDDKIEAEIGSTVQELLTKQNHIVVTLLKEKPLSARGKDGFSLKVDQQRHITGDSNTGRLQVLLGLEKTLKTANRQTEQFILLAKDAFRELRKDFQNFDKGYVYQLLIKYISDIEIFKDQNGSTFTQEYKVDMVLAFAGYMTVEFKELMTEVRFINNPLEALKRLKVTYRNLFLAQYKDIAGHGIAASNLCDLLIVAIEAAVFEKLPSDIADSIKVSSPDFYGKKYFKAKILRDLARKKNFALYKIYLKDIKSSFEWWAKQYVSNFCIENNKHNLKSKARNIVHQIVLQIDCAIQNITKGIAMKSWITSFHKSLSKVLKINLSEMQDIIEATHEEDKSDYFIEALTVELASVEDKVMKIIEDPGSIFLDITKWNKSPHLLLCDHLFGCYAQCPFCGEQCELTDANHISSEKDHFVKIHRPQCLRKFRWEKTQQLVFELCTALVESDVTFRNSDTNGEWVPYKAYRKIYKDWCISNESPKESPRYWQWFVSKYINEIVEWAGSAHTTIDHLGWADISEDEAIASLSEVYKISTII